MRSNDFSQTTAVPDAIQVVPVFEGSSSLQGALTGESSDTPPSQPNASRYTRRQIIFLFAMLLGGDFAFTFFEQVFGRVIPLMAADSHGSNTIIGVMTGSIAGLMNLFLLPNISIKSDRHRGPLGRRIPYLLWSTPFTVGSLLLIGFAPEIARWLHATVFLNTSVTEAGLVLGLLCLFAASYHLWNMILVNVYNWLIRDVVPPAMIGSFLAWFRVVSTLASFGFLWWAFPHAIDHRKTVFVAVGGVYLVIFLLMCWQVREGNYPEPAEQRSEGVAKTFVRYFRDCLSVPLYRNFFLAYVLMTVALISTGPFTTLYTRDRLGLSMEDIGRIAAWGTLAGALAFVPMGWLIDHFNPIWLIMSGLIGIVFTNLAGYFFVHDRLAWWVYTMVYVVPSAAWALGSSAFSMKLFPQEEFGQFSAGLNVFGYGGLTVGNYLVGAMLDIMGSRHEFVFLWTAALTGAALLPMTKVVRGWRAHGGPSRYVAPLPLQH